MKRFIVMFVIMLMALPWGTAQAKELHLIMVTHGQAIDPFWAVVKNGVAAAEKDLNVRVEYRAPETFDMVVMRRLIDTAVASRPDGLAVSIPDADTLGDAIRLAVNAGIVVVSLNSGSEVREQVGSLFHVGQDEYRAGFMAGERMKTAGVAKGLCVNYEVGNLALEQRCQGFEDGLEGSVDMLVTSTEPVEIRNAVSAYLSRDPHINGVLVVGTLGAEPALDALEKDGLIGKVQLATFDLSPAVLEAISEGKMVFAIDQQQYLQGYLPVMALTLYNQYGLMPAADIQTGPAFVTKENAGRVIELSKKGIR